MTDLTPEEKHIKDQLRAGLIARFPKLFDGAKQQLSQIYDLVRKYSQRREYEVTKTGFTSIYSIAYKYIEVRNGTFMPGSIVPSFDYSHDDFLTDIFEALTGIQRLATNNRDLELSRQISDCLMKIAIKCADIRYLSNSLQEYTHSMLAVQYMVQNIEDALKVGLLDIGIQGSDNLETISRIIVHKGAFTDVALIEDHLKKIALYGIANNASYLISHPLKTYSVILRMLIASKADGIAFQTLLENVAEIIMWYNLAPNRPQPQGMDIGFSLGPFIDMTYRTAIPYVYDEILLKLNDKNTSKDVKSRLIAQTKHLNDELWKFYDRLSKAAAENESFLVFYIDSNINHIAQNLFRLHANELLNYLDKNAIREDFRWLVSIYWRIYDYFKEIKGQGQYDILDHLLSIAFKCHKMGWQEEVKNIVSTMTSIAKSFFDKGKSPYNYEPIRILERAAYVCIMAKQDELTSYFVTNAKEMFWDRLREKDPEQSNRFFFDLLEIDPVQLEYSGSKINFEDVLLSSFNRKDIRLFVQNTYFALTGEKGFLAD